MLFLKPLILLGVSAIGSLLLAFVFFEVETLVWLIARLGLPILLMAVIIWGYYGLRCFESGGSAFRKVCCWLKGIGRWDVLFVLLVSVSVHLQETHKFKVLMDEVSLINTSRVIYEKQEAYSAAGLDYENEVFVLSRDGYVGKRPYLFPFAVSLVHFLTGYRWWNGFLLNALLTPFFFGLIIALVRSYVSRAWVGYLAVLLLVSFPFVGQVCSSSGMELLNACLLVLVTLSAVAYMRKPVEVRMQWMFASACLLAYARYESIIYVLAVALVWLSVCWRSRSIQLCKATAIFPLTLIPLIWIMRVVESKNVEYFQHEMLGLEHTFSAEYLQNNLSHFFSFLFQPQALSLNAPVTVLLLIGVLFIIFLRCLGVGPTDQRSDFLQVLKGPIPGFFLLSSLVQVLLMFYLWGNLNDPVAVRIVLPFTALWVAFAVCLWGVGFADKIKIEVVFCVAAFCLWCGVFAKKEYLAERTNTPVVRVNLASEWIREHLGLQDAVFSWNVQMFLPYRVNVFPEYNLFRAFDSVKQMQDAGIVNRVLLYHDSEKSKDLWAENGPYSAFCDQGGAFSLLEKQRFPGGSEIGLYELDFQAYRSLEGGGQDAVQ